MAFYSEMNPASAGFVQLEDGPPAYNEMAFYSEMNPASAGFVQLESSACSRSGVTGVTCGLDDEQLFATGMNGDEDLA